MQLQQSNQPNQETPSGQPHEFTPALSGHAWIQQGVMLTCQSCKPAHSTAILDKHGNPAVDYQLVGIDQQGRPKFRKVTIDNFKSDASAPK